MNVTIPKGNYDAPAPCWLSVADSAGKTLKPLIKCQCGQICGIGLHRVHADGRVIESFFHAREGEHPQGDNRGCGWHVFLQLSDYDLGDFPPRG